MSSQIQSELPPWQNTRFRPYEIPWVKAAESLLGDQPLVKIEPNKDGSRWTVYKKATGAVAIFSHAGVWSWASPPDTGNFVPAGESAPDGVYPTRVQSVLGRQVETSYAFNTEEDPSFYDSARIFEDYATALKGFNRHQKPRRGWQAGESDHTRRRFIFNSRLVLRRTPLNATEGSSPSDSLHPWLYDALKAQRYPAWIANPRMPAIMDFVEGKLRTIKPTSNRYFDNGDIVWFSFSLSFDVNPRNWIPEYTPLDFVRVGNVPQASSYGQADHSAMEAIESAYQSLSEGAVTLLDGSDDSSMNLDDDVLDRDVKRARDSDGDDTMSDSGLSDKSAYSVALAALEEPTSKRVKTEDIKSSKLPPAKATVVSEEVSKKKVSGKARAK